MIVIIVELLGDRFSAGHYVQLACLQGEAREGLIYHYVTWSHELANMCAHALRDHSSMSTFYHKLLLSASQDKNTS